MRDFLSILELVKPRKGEVFVDLGSGTGKAVLAAACGFPDFSKVPVGLFTKNFQKYSDWPLPISDPKSDSTYRQYKKNTRNLTFDV